MYKGHQGTNEALMLHLAEKNVRGYILGTNPSCICNIQRPRGPRERSQRITRARGESMMTCPSCVSVTRYHNERTTWHWPSNMLCFFSCYLEATFELRREWPYPMDGCTSLKARFSKECKIVASNVGFLFPCSSPV